MGLTSFLDGGNWSTWRKSPMCGKSVIVVYFGNEASHIEKDLI